MSRPRRKAFIVCEEKNKTLQTRKPVKSNTKCAPSAKEIKTQKCSVQLTPKDAIPQSMLNEKCIKQCSVKLTNSEIIPSNTVMKVAKNSVYKPLCKKSPGTPTRRRRQHVVVKTVTEKAERDPDVYDFNIGSQSSQSSGDDSTENIIKLLQKKNNVRIIKGRQKQKPHKRNLHKSWSDKNIIKAKKIIKPKINKLDKMQIIDVLKNDIVIPIVNSKPSAVPSRNPNESILPLIEDVVDDHHFGNDDYHFGSDDHHFGNDDHHFGNNDNDIRNEKDQNNSSELFNSNIENINPNSSPAKPKNTIQHANSLVRTPLKPLNSQLSNQLRASPRKGPHPLRNQLLKRLSFYNRTSTTLEANKSRRLQLNRQSPDTIEDANITNYFGFTSDLESETSKNSTENTSTPVRPTSKELLIAKLKRLKSSAIKGTPKISTRSQRKTRKPIIAATENNTINFKDALSSTLLHPSTPKKAEERTHSRHQNEYPENDRKGVELDLFDNLISAPPEEPRDIALDDIPVPKKSPAKKHPAKVYERKKYQAPNGKEDEDPELTSFYESFNKACQEVNNCKVFIE